jgi:hypothetical protein
VHYAAAIRYLLGPEVYFTRLSAFTTLLKEHLPPVDTMDAILKTNTGIQGTFQLSVATTLTGPEWTIGCEKGTVTISNPDQSALGGKDMPSYTQVTVRPVDGEEIVQVIPNERTGVPPEIRAWGESLAAGRQNPEQRPEEGLADLELVSTFCSPITIVSLKSMTTADSFIIDRVDAPQWRTGRPTPGLPISELGLELNDVC